MIFSDIETAFHPNIGLDEVVESFRPFQQRSGMGVADLYVQPRQQITSAHPFAAFSSLAPSLLPTALERPLSTLSLVNRYFRTSRKLYSTVNQVARMLRKPLPTVLSPSPSVSVDQLSYQHRVLMGVLFRHHR